MNTAPQNQSNNQEIDIMLFFNKVIRLIAITLFNILSFLKKYYLVIIILLVIGYTASYFLKKNITHIYRNEVIVIPNFDSSDYLYSMIENINSKIKVRDSTYFNNMRITNYNKLKRLEIQPIIDIYSFLSKQKENYDIFKILADNKNINNLVKDYTINKKYKYYKINIYLYGKEESAAIIQKILAYINENVYYNNYKVVNIAFTENKIEQNNQMITQIDNLLKAQSNLEKNNSQLFVLENHTNLNNLFETKEKLIKDINTLKLNLIAQQKIINDIVINHDILYQNKLLFLIKMIPILLLSCFFGFFLLKTLYKKLEQIKSH